MLDLSAILRTINATESETPFRAVKCTEAKMLSKTPINGFVYFTTDTHKIYCGLDNEYIPMGGTTGIYYGKRDLSDDEIFGDQTLFEFLPEDIESETMPAVNDLILNIPDGGFYRVTESTVAVLEAERLAIAGGGNGTGTGTSSSGYTITFHDNRDKAYAYNTTSMPISFTCNYAGELTNRISQVTFTFKGETEPFYTYSQEFEFNAAKTIDLFEYKHLFNDNKKTVVMMCHDLYGAQKSTNFTVQMVNLSLTKVRDNLLVARNSTYPYSCHLDGATSGITSKTIKYTLYNESNLMVPALVLEQDVDIAEIGEISTTLNLNGLAHGVYVLEVCAEAQVSGSTVKIPSETLTHKIAHFSDTSIPLLMVYIPETTEQYTNIPLNYIFVTEENNKNYSLQIKVNNLEKTVLDIQSNTMDTYKLYFEDQGTYKIEAIVPELSILYSEYIDIVAYTGTLPTINTMRSDLALYLTPRNKSNSGSDRAIWKDYNNKYTATLNGLHYGSVDGWMTNENDVNYLSLTSGASLSIPDFRPFQYNPTIRNDLNPQMGSGMTIELDFEITGVLNYSTELIKCISRLKGSDRKPAVGFTITGDKASFYGSTGLLMSLSLVEGKRTKLTFVIEPSSTAYPMVYGYINGKLSGAVMYKSAEFEEQLDDPAILQMDSTDARLKIYSVRFYYSALNDRLILNNYIASLDNLDAKQFTYDNNDVYDSNSNISYLKVSAEAYENKLQVPYMLLTGGYANIETDKWKRQNSTDKTARLPIGKKDYRAVDVKVVYPDTELFKDYKNYEFKNIYKNNLSMADAYGEKPTNGGAIMYAQGTSSMEYPVKNLRLRFKSEDDWYQVKPEIAPVEIICMKADYMESSGSHNTGAANLIDALYEQAGIQTPGQEHFDPQKTGKTVTCIKGHPCLIFYSPTGDENSYEYVGKYNLNLDKATPEPFGFNHDDSSFGYLSEGDKYFKVTYYDKQKPSDPTWIGQENPADGGDYFPGQTETEATVGAGEKINSIHCFEFLDNAVEVCNFKNKAKAYVDDGNGNKIPDPNGEYYTYEETWYNTFKNADNDDVPGWALGFESRYPEDRIGYHDADMLYPLASWLNELYTLRQTDEDKALKRFKAEYECYLDKNFTLAYYVITEALLMADSRVKNMMIATWGKGTRQYYPVAYNETTEKWYINTEAAPTETNNYIFYPIFYDMDTMMGLDNTGKFRFNYYSEDTDSNVYNGDEVLWTFVRDALGDEIVSMFNTLNKGQLYVGTDDTGLLTYFNNNQANLSNEAFYNGDAKYKYIKPAREGYQDHLNGKEIAAGAGPYLYAAQGDRSLMREWFMSNRMHFLQGKYNSEKFQGGDRIEYRWYYPSRDEDSGAATDSVFAGHENTTIAVPPSNSFSFTSVKTGYAGVKLGANSGDSSAIERFDGVQTKPITIAGADGANGTEAYLLGLSTLSDLGDLSDKYMQKFVVASSDVRLKNLCLGNPHKDYYNPYWGTEVDGQSATIDVTDAIYLETFNLQNCSTYNAELDFSNCTAINTILLTGSGVSGIKLPPNGILTELRLPATITALNIDSHNALTDDGFSMGGYTYDETDPRIGAGTGAYTSDYSQLLTINIKNTPINGYNIVKGASNLQKYYFENVNWTATSDDSQYCLLPANATLDDSVTYYTYNSEADEYRAWDNTTARPAILYKLVTMLDETEENIINIPVLDYLASRSPVDGIATADALSGTLTINIANVGVNEYNIYEKYIAIYPKLKIKFDDAMGDNVTKAKHIKFYTMDAAEVNADNIANASVLYETQTPGNTKTLAALTANEQFKAPIKGSNNTTTFEFNGMWKDYDSNVIYYQDEYFDTAPIEDAVAFSACTPNADMKLFPYFNAITRTYTIKFYNYNHPDDNALLMTLTGEYDQNILDLVTANSVEEAKLYYAYRPDETNFTDVQRYAFKGWQSEISFNNNDPNPVLYNIEDLKIRSDMNLFAYYVVENAEQIITPLKYFNINNNAISIKDNYSTIIQGKITLPYVDGNGNTITQLNSFSTAVGLTHIYFLTTGTSSYTHVNNYAFKELSALKKIKLPSSIRVIGVSAFEGCIELEEVNLNDNIIEIQDNAFKGIGSSDSECMKVSINELPTALTALGSHAFCYGGPNIKITKLPVNITQILGYTFGWCPNVIITTLGSNDGSARLTTLHDYALSQAGKNCTDGVNVHINSSITVIGENAFTQYLSENATMIFYNTLDTNKTDILYYSTTALDATQLSSPKNSYTTEDGIVVENMGCFTNAKIELFNTAEQTYVEGF